MVSIKYVKGIFSFFFLKVSIQRVCWRAVILDEGHRIKNMETLTAKSAVLVRCAPYPNSSNHDLQIIAILIVISITAYFYHYYLIIV